MTTENEQKTHQTLDNQISVLKAKREKTKQLIEAAEEEINKQTQLFQNIIKEKNIFFIADKSKYVMLDNDKGEWTHFKDAMGLHMLIGVRSKKSKTMFEDALAMEDRIKRSAVNTFNKTKEDELNFMSTEGWLKPTKGTPHPVFDILLESLSGGDKQAQDHIEHVIAYKYLHPEDYRLPCISIFGEGGVGKNEFVSKVLGAIFGENQVGVMSNNQAFGQYNGTMLGKTVVFVDESVIDRADHESMKAKVGSKKIHINIKYGLAGEFDNTALYMTGGNDESGSVVVKGDSTDRRWSIIHVEKNIMHWISHKFNTRYNKNETDDFNQETLTVWNEDLFPALEKSEHVAKWLGYIIDKWQDAARPATFHGKAYKNLLEIQKSVQEQCFEYVFNQPDFEHIELNDVYNVYLLMVTENRGKSGGNLGKGKFKAQAIKWLKVNNKNVIDSRMNIKTSPDCKTSGIVFHCMDGNSICDRNTSMYLRKDKYEKLFLQDLNYRNNKLVDDRQKDTARIFNKLTTV